jgi:hypothetical protein
MASIPSNCSAVLIVHDKNQPVGLEWFNAGVYMEQNILDEPLAYSGRGRPFREEQAVNGLNGVLPNPMAALMLLWGGDTGADAGGRASYMSPVSWSRLQPPDATSSSSASLSS